MLLEALDTGGVGPLPADWHEMSKGKGSIYPIATAPGGTILGRGNPSEEALGQVCQILFGRVHSIRSRASKGLSSRSGCVRIVLWAEEEVRLGALPPNR